MRHAAIYFIALASIAMGHQSASAEIVWEPKLREAHAKAKESGRLMLLHFYTDNCVYCDRLEAGAFQNQLVTNTINQNFVAVKVHGAKNKKLTEMFKVSKYPTDVIVTTDGKALSHSVSPQQPERYMAMLAKASSQYTPPNPYTPPRSAPSGTQPAAQGTMIAGQAPASSAPSNTSAPTNNAGNQSGTPNPYALPPETIAAAPAISSVAQSTPPSGMGLPTDVNGSTDQLGPGQLPVQIPVPGSQTTSQIASQPSELPAANTPRTNQFMVPSAKTNEGINASLAGVRTNGMTLAAPGEAPADPSKEATADSAAQELPELAIQGYCAVSVVNDGQWVEGNPDLGVIHLGKLYLFANQSAMEKFLSDPMPFTPMLNEIDVVRFFEEKRIVPGKREWGVIDPIHNRMFFFSDEAAMLHFEEQFDRYLDASISVMDEAIKQSNPGV